MKPKEIKHVKIRKDMKVSELVKEMSAMGFSAKNLAKAAEILEKMIQDKDCKIFLGLAGAMVPAGMKEIILDMLNHVDVLVSTGANLTHDLIEAIGHKHYQGSENLDDVQLNKNGIDRIYNVLMKNEVYQDMEKFFQQNFNEFSKCENIKDFLWKIGQLLPQASENSILKKCYEKGIPLFCPAIADSGIGLMVWGGIAAGKKISIDAFSDMKEIIDTSWTAKKAGVIYIGGGVPKNFIQQALQFTKGSSYGIQITTDRPEYGGSSGASLKEGISWGKLKSNADFTDLYCDSTISLPLIWAAVKDRL